MLEKSKHFNFCLLPCFQPLWEAWKRIFFMVSIVKHVPHHCQRKLNLCSNNKMVNRSWNLFIRRITYHSKISSSGLNEEQTKIEKKKLLKVATVTTKISIYLGRNFCCALCFSAPFHFTCSQHLTNFNQTHIFFLKICFQWLGCSCYSHDHHFLACVLVITK